MGVKKFTHISRGGGQILRCSITHPKIFEININPIGDRMLISKEFPEVKQASKQFQEKIKSGTSQPLISNALASKNVQQATNKIKKINILTTEINLRYRGNNKTFRMKPGINQDI